MTSTTTPTPDGWQVFTEEWDPAYGAPATFEIDDAGRFEQVEDGPPVIVPPSPPPTALCFVDGVRRQERVLWAEQRGSGRRVPGLAGAYAVGAVVARPGGRADYQGIRIGRVLLWAAGYHGGDLVARTGHRWIGESTAAEDPGELLARLQDRMRESEGVLALEAAGLGWTVVLDGPLNRVRSLHAPVAGYVKTHRRQILPDAAHTLVPGLPVGCRTPIYGDHTSDRYTCYLRVGEAGPGASPWSGIARLELPAVAGLDAAEGEASRLAALLPRYAGVPHRDPRAPVNLTPVKNLERHLTRLMGPVNQATRAARDAVMGSVA
jgi:hypothetical protein